MWYYIGRSIRNIWRRYFKRVPITFILSILWIFFSPISIMEILFGFPKEGNFIASIFRFFFSLFGWFLLMEGALLIRFIIRNSKEGIKADAEISDEKTLSFIVHPKEVNAGKRVFEDHLTFNDLNRHFICFGGSGSGKTYSFGKPILSFFIDRRPGIVIDPKGDLAEVVETSRCKHPMFFFNPDSPKTSRINPLSLLNTKPDIIQYTDYFLSNVIGIPKDDSAVYFFNSCNAIMSSLIMFLKKRHVRYCTIPHVIGILLTVNHKDLYGLISQDQESARMAQILKTASMSEKNISAIMSTFSSFFSKLDIPNIFYSLTSDSDADVLKNAPNDTKNPYTLVLSINSPSKQSLYAPIFSSIAGSLLMKMNTPDQLESFFFSDEFSVFKFPKYSLIPETARSNGICSILIMQDLEQLVRNYGKEEAISIVGNHSNHFLFGTRNNETINYYESLIGTIKVSKETQSKSDTIPMFGAVSSSEGHSSTTEREHVLDKNSMAHFEKGEFFGTFNDCNHRVLSGYRLDGNHYLSTTSEAKKYSGSLSEHEQKMLDAYDKVYDEVQSVLSVKEPTAVKPFNI